MDEKQLQALANELAKNLPRRYHRAMCSLVSGLCLSLRNLEESKTIRHHGEPEVVTRNASRSGRISI